MAPALNGDCKDFPKNRPGAADRELRGEAAAQAGLGPQPFTDAVTAEILGKTVVPDGWD